MSSSLSPHADGCPACRERSLAPFYRLKNIPVHSCLLLPSSEEARAFPRAKLELAICPACGFICNTQFDPRWSAYSQEYEDQQSFSPTFNRFAKVLAQDLISRYALYSKDVLEIGCGKGDFLVLLSKLGDNRAVGIDPSIHPERQRHGANGRIKWIAEYFGQQHAFYPVDFLCCRHTLEHIYDVNEFMGTLVRVIGERQIPVFFEVPDSMRVLNDCALEDIYYEHCSYFTAGSLARLFRHFGFAVTTICKAYDDQYLLLEAMAGEQLPEFELPRVESVDEVVAAVERFQDALPAKLKEWRDMMDHNTRIALWGSGSKCVSLLSSLDLSPDNICVVDINPYRHGRYMAGSGMKIMPPDYLRKFKPQRVVAMNRIYQVEIGEMLRQMHVSAELIAL